MASPKTTLLVSLSILACVSACKPEGSGSGEGGGGASGSCPTFVDIQGGTFSKTADQLVWTLTVADLPSELPFNHDGVGQDVLEYSWGVRVDPEADGTEDYLVAVEHFVSGAEVTGDILSHTKHKIGSIEGALTVDIGTIDATISGQTFTLTVDANEDAGLSGVSETSVHHFQTLYNPGNNPGGKLCQDDKTGLD